MNIAEKVQALKKKYPSEQSFFLIEKEEKRIYQLLARQNVFQTEAIVSIVEILKGKVFDIKEMLSSDESLNDAQRQGLFRMREAFEYFIKLISPQEITNEIEQLEKGIDDELARD